jgi:hypothetical protein
MFHVRYIPLLKELHTLLMRLPINISLLRS